MSNLEQISKANRLMSQSRYADALSIYKELTANNSRLSNYLKANIEICRNRLQASDDSVYSFSLPKISILVPTYNVEKYIEECLDSIIDQRNIEDLEIICINDGSTDRSAELLFAYQQKYDYIKIINQPNSGYGAAINIGLKYAKGDYIGIVEPDDYIASNMYYDLIKVAENNKELDIIRATAIAFTQDGPLDGLYGQVPKSCLNRVFDMRTEPDMLTAAPAIWACIYKRDFLVDANITLPESLGASYQDVAFFLQASIFAKKIKAIWYPYYFYRNDNLTASRFSKGKVDVIFDMYDWLQERIPLFDNAWSKQIVDRMMNDFKWGYGRIDDLYKMRYLNNVAIYFDKLNKVGIDLKHIDSKFLGFYQDVIKKSDLQRRGVGGFTVQKNQPLITLIVPVYNAQDHIYEFLDSIIEQNYAEYEIILVDDCSIDGTLSKLANYNFKDLKYKIIPLSRNQGASNARNIGLEYASGVYVRFVDCDDVLPSGSLAYFASIVRQYRSDVFKGFLYGFDYKTQKVFQNFWGGRIYESKLIVNKLPHECPEVWNLYDHQAFVIRKDLIYKYKIRYPVLKNYQDPPFVAQCLAVSSKITLIPKDVYHLVCNRGIKTITRSEWSVDNFRSLMLGVDQALRSLSEAGLYMIVKYKISTFIKEWFDKLTALGTWKDLQLRNEIFEGIRNLQVDYAMPLLNPHDEVKHQILAFMIVNQSYDDAQELLKKIKLMDYIGGSHLYYYPFWDERNPYLDKIYEKVANKKSRGTLVDAIVRCINIKDQKTVFHLHWTDLYIQKATLLNDEQAYKKAYYYARLIEIFKSVGGILVWTMHNFQPHELKYAVPEKILMVAILDNADNIIVHNEVAKKYLLANYFFDNSKIIVARHGNYIGCYKDDLSVTQARKSFNIEEDVVHFVFVGQVRPYKGVERIIEAFNKLSGKYLNVRLTIAGSFPDKEYKERLHELIEKNASNSIILRDGFIKDDELQRYMKSADFLVFPYKRVLTSGSILMALGFSCPVIVTKNEVVDELIDDGCNGFIVQNDLYETMEKAYKLDKNSKLAMRLCAYDVALNNNWHPMQNAIENILI